MRMQDPWASHRTYGDLSNDHQTAINTFQDLHSLSKEPSRQVLAYIDTADHLPTQTLPSILV